jgi:hypothetical protein
MALVEFVLEWCFVVIVGVVFMCAIIIIAPFWIGLGLARWHREAE